MSYFIDCLLHSSINVANRSGTKKRNEGTEPERTDSGFDSTLPKKIYFGITVLYCIVLYYIIVLYYYIECLSELVVTTDIIQYIT